MQFWILVTISLAEVALFIMLLRFFARLRRSEALLTELSEGQQGLMDKLQAVSELEQELMHSFASRQENLQRLNGSLDQRATELSFLLEQAETVSRSPQFLRELILSGRKKGRTPVQLAKSTGLSLDEVELILTQKHA